MSIKDKREAFLKDLTKSPASQNNDDDVAIANRPGTEKKSILSGRTSAIGSITNGKRSLIKQLRHSPGRVQLWHGHNRNYNELSVERCADLIESFKRAGRQEFPAIVRLLKDSETYDYELICGARRHWTAAHLGWDLLIEVRDLDDKQAFILQDIENRDREDISDYERACDYVNALPLYFNNNQTEMAKFLEIDRPNFIKLLYLQSLPKQIVTAYADQRDLKVHHGLQYKKFLEDTDTKQRVIARAKGLAKQPVNGKTVLAELTKAAKPTSSPAKIQKEQFGHITLDRRGKNGMLGLTVKLPQAATADQLKALQTDFQALLKSVAETG